MVPDDLFLDDVDLSGMPSLDLDFLDHLRAGRQEVPDLEAAFALVALLRSEYLLYGTEGGQSLNDTEVSHLQRATRQVVKRLGIELSVPWRDFSGFRGYLVSHDGYGSWQARREMIAKVFDPVQDQLELLDDEALETGAGKLVAAVTSHDSLGWPSVDSEIEQIRTALHRARSPLEYREVGLACVALLEALSDVCYDPARHLYSGETEPPVSKTKQRLDRVIEHELRGEEFGKELVRLVKCAAELSQAVKHSSTRTRTEAGVTADTVFLIANMLRRLRSDSI